MAKNKEIKNMNISLKMTQHCWPLEKTLLCTPMMLKESSNQL
jgi:hypothetical protein